MRSNNVNRIADTLGSMIARSVSGDLFWLAVTDKLLQEEGAAFSAGDCVVVGECLFSLWRDDLINKGCPKEEWDIDVPTRFARLTWDDMFTPANGVKDFPVKMQAADARTHCYRTIAYHLCGLPAHPDVKQLFESYAENNLGRD